MSREKCVLAYSGGLDTSVAIRWIQENYDMDVIALAIDVGQERQDLEFVRTKALGIGAVESVVKDVREEYVEEFISRALWANALYENKYPLVSAMSRPIIVKHLVEEAHRFRAKYIAHGCTGKGNDQVRFEVGISALDPDIEVLAPVREWDLKTREQEMDWAAERGIPVPTTKDNPYSIDDNLWGRAIECGVLEDPWVEPPADIYTLTNDARGDACGEPEYVVLSFEQGLPVALDGELCSFQAIIERMNDVAGRHGFGRIDMIENRLIGVKSREIYEVPGALTLITAHKALEDLCLEREVLHYKLRLQPSDLRRGRLVRPQGRQGLHRPARTPHQGVGAPTPQGGQRGRGLDAHVRHRCCRTDHLDRACGGVVRRTGAHVHHGVRDGQAQLR